MSLAYRGERLLEALRRSEELGADNARAVARARALLVQTADLLVAAHVQMDKSANQTAHAIYDIGPLTVTRGVTLCDLLAGEEVGVLTDLAWSTVPDEFRCVECEDRSSRLLARR